MLLFWLVLQVLALALAAGRVPLSAHFPTPIERQATAELLVVQIMSASVLFPSLLKDLQSWLVATLAIWPMLALAGLLGGESARELTMAGAFVVCWLTTLAAWNGALAGERARRVFGALAALWAIGGPVLLYLKAEFNSAGWNSPLWLAAGGPAAAAVIRLRGGDNLFFFDLCNLAALCGGLIAAGAAKLRQREKPDKLSTKF